jgi:murein DD-endopeptidase MepM/ murein hydrolase activator NlpD
LRPRLAFPAYLGRVPADGLAPIYNLFDRTGGGVFYSQRVSRATCVDFRGRRLTYDEHDGVDFVCPVGTPLVAAAPGVVVLRRDRWLRGGLTVGVDHGGGVITQYTHCARVLVALGQEVARGEPVALSGASGLDLVQFFPWVPPHVHFMAWHRGRPVDPFLRPGETSPVSWMRPNEPAPDDGRGDDTTRRTSDVDVGELERATRACSEPALREELAALATQPAAWAATLEDALHHQREAWGFAPTSFAIRPSADLVPRRISLPLDPTQYRGARFADTGHPATASLTGV